MRKKIILFIALIIFLFTFISFVSAVNCWSYTSSSTCTTANGCKWKNDSWSVSGWCDPKAGGFSSASSSSGGGVGGAMGGDCYKYDGNQTQCTNKTIVNISCGWTTNPSPSCDVNWGADCWRYNSVNEGCNVTNGCWFKSDSWGNFCTNLMDQCWQNQSLQGMNNANCSANRYCINNSWGGCEPRCSSLNSSTCTNATYTGKCKWNSGWCNPSSMNEMFNNMEAGAPTPLGFDSCPEAGMQASVDICGFGLKDMGDSYGIGMNVNNFENSSVCNKEKLSSVVMGHTGGGPGFGAQTEPFGSGFGQEKTGSGNDSVTALVYLDSDGSTIGGCALSHNS